MKMFISLSIYCLLFLQEYKTYYDITVKRFSLTKLPKYLTICIKVRHLFGH